MSPDLVVVLCLVAILVGLVLAARRKKALRVAAARTVELTIDRHRVRRSLGDGRVEEALWRDLREVELIRTPVRTADGARAFVLLDSGTDLEPAGCLVPLGAGYDDELLVELTRLPGFRMDRYQEAVDARRTGRDVLWQRAPQPPADGPSGGGPTTGGDAGPGTGSAA